MTIRKPNDLDGLLRAFPYPRSAAGATSDLALELIKGIKKSGPMPFSTYMGQCLYHPVHGYYSRPRVPTASKEGDFITSVSVGQVFGWILADRIFRFWQANGSPADFAILEPGGHDGQLAQDILDRARHLAPEFEKALNYHLYEPHPDRRSLAARNLEGRATVIASPGELASPLGVVLANEILDALPVPLFLHHNTEWSEVAVAVENKELTWTLLPSEFSLEGSYPEGYVTEGSPDFQSFLAPLVDSFDRSLMIFIDYGMDQESLDHPDRHVGTLRCYRNHRSNVHPLDSPGLCDLTADVNFTALENCARELSLDPHPMMEQSRYLTYCGRDWLLSSPSPEEVRQFQTLIHPSQFGTRFHVAEFTKGEVSRSFPQ